MTHPALSMLKVWVVCVLLYTVLPFYLVEKQLTLQGIVILLLFVGGFCFGTLLVKPRRRMPAAPPQLDFSNTERLLATASGVAIVSLLLDMQSKSIFDLAVSYELRSDQAAALMEGSQSSSSMWFQIGFLTYPAGYAYLVRAIVFERRPSLTRLGAFGLLPVLMGTLAMGGRAPLLYAILISLFAWGARAIFMRRRYPRGGRRRKLSLASTLMIAIGVSGALYYFIAVFFTRAEGVGGASGMFAVAESIWGVGFRGPMADLMFSVLGDEVTYVIFIFNWYVVQGLPMSNILFSDYNGPMQLGVYGVDLISALVRRLDGARVARDFDLLQQLGTYGFLPSAFGSLYVDLWFFGIVVSVAWGAAAGLVYQRIRSAGDSRWLMLAPVVSMGILFSLINTPLGFSNGLVTHLWMVAAFISARPFTARRSNPALASSTT